MDLTMPGGGGFVAANQIRNSGSRAKILIFTTHSSSQLEGLSRMAGFDGLVHKTDGARDLVRGVRAVLGGNKFFRAEVVKAAAALA
jgi:two-component system, NarL family, invasion response regulator UvrY